MTFAPCTARTHNYRSKGQTDKLFISKEEPPDIAPYLLSDSTVGRWIPPSGVLYNMNAPKLRHQHHVQCSHGAHWANSPRFFPSLALATLLVWSCGEVSFFSSEVMEIQSSASQNILKPEWFYCPRIKDVSQEPQLHQQDERSHAYLDTSSSVPSIQFTLNSFCIPHTALLYLLEDN